jgi:hypothetical protein
VAKDVALEVRMNMSRWWPYLAIGGVVLVLFIAYPLYFNWWDHKSCRDSGGTWNEAAGQCVEPRNADIPDTRGSPSFEDDNQGGDRPRE